MSMRIYRRTGKRSGVSMGFGTYMFLKLGGLMMVVGGLNLLTQGQFAGGFIVGILGVLFVLA